MTLDKIKKAVKDQGDRIMADTGKPLNGTDLGRTLDAMASILFNLFGEKKPEYPGPCHECGKHPEKYFYRSTKDHVYCDDCAHMFQNRVAPLSDQIQNKGVADEVTKFLRIALAQGSNWKTEEIIEQVAKLRMHWK